MASIDIITADGRRLPAGSKAPKGARYRARYRTPNGASRMKTYARKLDAERFLADNTVKAAAGTYVDPAAGKATFGTYAQSWAAAQPHRASTAAGMASILRTHILPSFGDRPIGSIRPSDVQAWVSGLELAPSTVALVYGKLVGIFRAAEDDRVITRSPCGRRIRLPRADGREVVPMSADQMWAIIESIDDRFRAFVVLMAGSGLRPAEALGLTPERVDFLRRSIRVDRQLITVTGEPPRHGPVKTPSSVRTIPVPQAVLDDLAQHLERFPTAGHDGLIFTDLQGRGVRRDYLSRVWRRAVRSAGVDGFTPHDLRHYAASVLIDQGASVKAVQRHLGHASATTTLDTYAHLWPESEEVTRRALGAGLERAVSSLCHDAPARPADLGG